MVAAVLSVDPLNVILHVGKTLAYKRKSTLLPPSIHVCIGYRLLKLLLLLISVSDQSIYLFIVTSFK